MSTSEVYTYSPEQMPGMFVAKPELIPRGVLPNVIPAGHYSVMSGVESTSRAAVPCVYFRGASELGIDEIRTVLNLKLNHAETVGRLPLLQALEALGEQAVGRTQRRKAEQFQWKLARHRKILNALCWGLCVIEAPVDDIGMSQPETAWVTSAADLPGSARIADASVVVGALLDRQEAILSGPSDKVLAARRRHKERKGVSHKRSRYAGAWWY